MINRERAAYLTSGKESVKITYNLAGPIQLVRSKDHFGIQIADIIASACCYCLNNPKESYSNSFINTIMPSFHLCVIPESEYADLTLREPFVNSLVLAELTERSRAGKDLLTDMLEFVLRAFDSYAAKISGSK